MNEQPVAAKEVFYVGYFPVPRMLRRWLMAVVSCVALMLVVTGAIIAMTKPDPGTGVWKDAQLMMVCGPLMLEPVPMVRAQGGGTGDQPGMPEGIFLIVNSGKHGSAERLKDLADGRVCLKGTVLEREADGLGGGMRVLELADGDDAAERETAVASAGSASGGEAPVHGIRERQRNLGRKTLRGEIVDFKCYMGAMKPGEGKTHKECATLCITGGIPAVLVVAGGDAGTTGASRYYVLTDVKGGPIDAAIYPLIAEAVEVTGDASIIGGVPVLRIAAGDVRTLR